MAQSGRCCLVTLYTEYAFFSGSYCLSFYEYDMFTLAFSDSTLVTLTSTVSENNINVVNDYKFVHGSVKY